MAATRVSPAQVKAGNKIATKYQEFDNGDIRVIKTREVKKVEFCSSKPENVHLDHECYDSRFSTIILANK